MALARGLLAFLPLDRLLRTNLLSPELIWVRLQRVNGISWEEFQAGRKNWKDKLDPRDHYVKLCSYQGEVSTECNLYVPALWAALRALQTKEIDLYVHLMLVLDHPIDMVGGPSLQITLETGNPLVQAIALQRLLYVSDDPETLESNIAAEAVPWTPALRRFFLSHIADGSNLSQFLRLSASVPVEEVAAGYPLGRNNPLAESLVTDKKSFLQMLAMGYFSEKAASIPGLTVREIVDVSLAYIRPKMLLIVLDRWDLSMGEIVLKPRKISRALVRRAGEMLQILVPRLPPASRTQAQYLYILSLRIIFGLPLNSTDILWVKADDFRCYLMMKVAHPQVDSEMVLRPFEELNISSSVFYDIPRVSRIIWEITRQNREVRFQMPNYILVKDFTEDWLFWRDLLVASGQLFTAVGFSQVFESALSPEPVSGMTLEYIQLHLKYKRQLPEYQEESLIVSEPELLALERFYPAEPCLQEELATAREFTQDVQATYSELAGIN